MKSVEVVAGLIFQQTRLLVCQRKENGPFPLKWEFPGGKVEKGESHETALRRELREELGIEICDLKQIFRHEHNYSNAVVVDLRFYRIDSFSGEIENRVFHHLRWTTLEDLPSFDFLEGDLPLVRLLISSQAKEFVS
jgi:8-oxo-dGTP diphosphatase